MNLRRLGGVFLTPRALAIRCGIRLPRRRAKFPTTAARNKMAACSVGTETPTANADMATIKVPHLHRTQTGIWRIKCRHSVVGGMIDKSTKTKDPDVAIQISDSLTELLRNPHWRGLESLPEAQRLFHPVAVSAFYDRLPRTELTRKHEHDDGRPPDQDRSLMVVHLDPDEGVVQYAEPYQRLADAHGELSIKYKLAVQRIEMLEEMLAQNGVTLCQLTVRAAFDTWIRSLNCKSERQKAAVVRRARYVIDKIAAARLSDLTVPEIIKAVGDSMKAQHSKAGKATSAYEASYRTRDFKRFAVWAADEFNIRTLERTARKIVVPSLTKIARTTGVDVLDMLMVSKILNAKGRKPFDTTLAATYWRALIAVLVYAGPRLSELAALGWSDIDWNKKLISVRDGERELKTEKSNRPIKPLCEVWPHLQALKLVTGKSEWVFPAFTDGKLQSYWWLEIEGGKLIAKKLTRALIRLEDTLGLGRKIAMRARRTCRGLMITKGIPTAAVNLMMGHSGAIGAAHYENALQIVSAIAM